MPSSLRRAPWLLLAIAGAAAAGQDARIQRNAEELAKLRNRIDAVSQSISTDRSQQGSLQNAVEDAERAYADAGTQLRRVEAQIGEQEARVRQAQDEHAAAARHLAAQQEVLARQLRAAYILDTGGRTELMLGQDQPDRVGRLLVYYDYLSRARQAAIDAVATELREVADQEANLRQALEALHGLQGQRRKTLDALESQRRARRVAVNQLQDRLAGENQELGHLQNSEKELQKLLESLKRALANAPPLSPHSPYSGRHGSMQWPLRGTILANYGDSKTDGRLQWKGIWIEAPEGAPVHASAAGRVAYVGWLSSFGLIVVLEHDKGLFTLYGHNASVAKSVGDAVAAGDTIAAAGNTGGYEQPGLYFEVRRGAEPMDPREWLTR